MPLPTIETPRLVLRPRRPSDFDACRAMATEPETLRWRGEGAAADPVADAAALKARMRTRWPTGMGYWVIEDQDTRGTFGGWVMLVPEDGSPSSIEIGWCVPTALRGQGYAPEAAANLITYGFTALGLTRIVAITRSSNTASCRVAEKIGMRLSADGGADPDEEVRYEARLDCAI